MIVCPPWDAEYAVSVHPTPPASADDVTRYIVTLTRASAIISAGREPVQIIRKDAELPASAALPIKEVWTQTLLATRDYETLSDAPVDGAMVEFVLSRPNQPVLRGELPLNPDHDISTFGKLGALLVKYCEANRNEQDTLAEEIEKTAKSLLQKKRHQSDD